MEKLITGLGNRAGKILDVAYGNGATTQYLRGNWDPGRHQIQYYLFHKKMNLPELNEYLPLKL